jgi:hypothetical protein
MSNLPNAETLAPEEYCQASQHGKNLREMNNTQYITNKLAQQTTERVESNAYGRRHVAAWNSGHPIADLITGLARYADTYNEMYPDSTLGQDYVLGECWINALRGIRGLLNGDIGTLDGGLTDAIIVTLATRNGFDEVDL